MQETPFKNHSSRSSFGAASKRVKAAPVTHQAENLLGKEGDVLVSEKNTVLVGEMLVEETPEEEFGLVEGPLGHSPDEMMDERFFNTALWEAETFQMTLAI